MNFGPPDHREVGLTCKSVWEAFVVSVLRFGVCTLVVGMVCAIATATNSRDLNKVLGCQTTPIFLVYFLIVCLLLTGNGGAAAA